MVMDAIDAFVSRLAAAHPCEYVDFVAFALESRAKFSYMRSYAADGDGVKGFPTKQSNFHAPRVDSGFKTITTQQDPPERNGLAVSGRQALLRSVQVFQNSQNNLHPSRHREEYLPLPRLSVLAQISKLDLIH